MTYDPTRPTVRQLVLDSIEATIKAIALPDYGTKFETVRQWNGNVLTVNAYPCALIIALEDQHDDTRMGIIENVLDVAIAVGVRGQDWPARLDRAMADIRVALLNDWNRGGVAASTSILHTLVWDSEPTSPIAAAQVLVRVLYRTLYEDPTTPK